MALTDLKAKVLGAAASAALLGTVVLGTAGANLVQQSEGYYPTAYRDPIGIVTVCWGHTSKYLRMGMTFTREECELLFKSDVIKHQVVLLPGTKENCIGNVPLNPNQIDALTSLTFNIGTGNFCGSSLARKLRKHDYVGAGAEFPKWKYAGGKVLPGLVTRRAKEQDLFRSVNTWVSWDLKELVVMGSAKAEDRR